MHRRAVIKALAGGAVPALLGEWGRPRGARAQGPGDELRALLGELGMQVPAQRAVAPDFALHDLAGTTVRLADLKGRALLLYFWATW